jgi:hypothetical protein
MLDEHDGQALSAHAHEKVPQRRHVGSAEPGGRLVQQDDTSARRGSDRDGDHALRPKGQFARQTIVQRFRNFVAYQMPPGLRLDLPPSAALDPGQEERAGERAWRPIQERAGHVPKHGHAAEEGVLLECAAQAKSGEPMRRDVGHVRSVQHQAALMGRHVRRRHEARAFASSVWPDDPEDATSVDRPAHLAKSLESAEAHRKALHREKRRFSSRGRQFSRP